MSDKVEALDGQPRSLPAETEGAEITKSRRIIEFGEQTIDGPLAHLDTGQAS